MFAMLFTITFYISFIILLRFICKNHISARLRYALWLLVAVKLLVFPVPNLEGNFSVLGFLPAGIEGMYLPEEVSEAEGNNMAGEAKVPRVTEQGSNMASEAEPGQMTENGNLRDMNFGVEDGTNAAGTDYGTESASAGDDRSGFSGWLRLWQAAKLRLQHYIENVLKVPVWVVLVWASGSAVCAVLMGIYHFRLGRYLRKKRVRLEPDFLLRRNISQYNTKGESGEDGNIYSVAGLPTPCLFGKSIYIPERLAEDTELLPYILKHEKCHYNHGDHLWGLVRMLCVCLYWYHPLVWLAAWLSRQDCELACDEAVVKNMAGENRKRYGELLLEFALVKSSPADCFSMTTAMSGNAKGLKERLQRITGKKRGWIAGGIIAVLFGIAGIYACMTSGFVSPDKQWQYIQIRQQEESIPVLQESYEVEYRLSRDAASYGLYIEAYEYGELVSAEILDCMALSSGAEQKQVKKGEAIFSREVESEGNSGAYIKIANSYSLPDYLSQDGASSSFKAFTLELPKNCIGNSFSFASAAEISHRFHIGEDVILAADYYGNGKLQTPGGHIFSADEFMAAAEETMRNDRYVILTHFIVSDQPPETLEKQLETLVKNKTEQGTGGDAAGDSTGAGTEDKEAETGTGTKQAETGTEVLRPGSSTGYSDEELIEMAGNYYQKEHGFTPAHIEIDSENGDEVLIWLYDINEYINMANDIMSQTSTRDWYTVDRTTGRGENVLFEEINLTEAGMRSRAWTKTPESMTISDVSTPEAFGALPAEPQAPADNRLYLLGQTDSYALYGTGDYSAMIVKDGDVYTEISVPFIVDGITMQTPEIQEADYDRDGEMELAVKLLWGEGTGIRKEKLWMFDKKDGLLKAFEYYDSEFSAELLRQLSWEKNGSVKRILLNWEPISPKLQEEENVSFREMSINTNRVSFAFQDGKIKLRTLISGGKREGSVMPAYGDAALEAEVLYQDGGSFSLLEARSADLQEMNAAAEKAVRDFYAPKEVEFVNRVYNEEAWTFSEEEGESMEMTLTVLEEGMDSYDYVTVPLTRDSTGEWRAANIWAEK